MTSPEQDRTSDEISPPYSPGSPEAHSKPTEDGLTDSSKHPVSPLITSSTSPASSASPLGSTVASESSASPNSSLSDSPATMSNISRVNGKNYHVAGHSMSISLFGYALDPQEVKIPEIIMNRSMDERRLSQENFNPNQIGQRVIDIIRGYWSQPGFASTSIVNQTKLADEHAILNLYQKRPHFPHRTNMGRSWIQSEDLVASTSKDNDCVFWIPHNKEYMFDLITTLCEKMLSIFRDEDRILQVGAPCIVLGDIHGNLIDLRTYEHTLWPKAPACNSNNFLFLGDYVDRGEYSLECILYLFAMKSLAPDRFFLLRGNHEVATIQRQYTFAQECETKFGIEMGRHIWRELNKVFDVMPLGAIVDKNIFCAHGGIPRTISDVSKLKDEIPCPMDNPESQCSAAWEMLWNDPITDQELVAMLEMDSVALNQLQMNQESGANKNSATLKNNSIPPKDKALKSMENNQNISNENQNELNSSEMDRILTRNNSDIDIMHYIKPDNPEINSNQDKLRLEKSTGPQNRDQDNYSIKPNNTSDNLRKYPSDTSSIASASPQQLISDGFISNIKRGTAYLFSDQAVAKFLKANKLSHVIRAHEVVPNGFTFHGDGRVITIFSSSKYCGLDNQSACCLVDRELIRILRLETGPDLD